MTGLINDILYWDGMDAYGFVIFHQIRSYFVYTKSIMMDSIFSSRFTGEGLVAALVLID